MAKTPEPPLPRMKKRTGFAVMDPGRRKLLTKKGNRKMREKHQQHTFTSDGAKKAANKRWKQGELFPLELVQSSEVTK